MNRTFTRIATGGALALILVVATPALADSDKRPEMERGHEVEREIEHGMERERAGFSIKTLFAPRNPELVGKVTVINGTTLTVEGNTPREKRDNGNGTQLYTVDASAAQVFKGATTTTLAQIVAGDTIVVQGTLEGTTIKAKMIRTGVPNAGAIMRNVLQRREDRREDREERREDRMASTTPIVRGNGQPVIFGTVSALQGTTFTLTNKGSVAYTVDAASSTIVKRGATTTLSSVAVGDAVTVQGAVSGSSVSASAVVDHGSATTTPKWLEDNGVKKQLDGLFNRLGGMFFRVFGF